MESFLHRRAVFIKDGVVGNPQLAWARKGHLDLALITSQTAPLHIKDPLPFSISPREAAGTHSLSLSCPLRRAQWSNGGNYDKVPKLCQHSTACL